MQPRRQITAGEQMSGLRDSGSQPLRLAVLWAAGSFRVYFRTLGQAVLVTPA